MGKLRYDRKKFIAFLRPHKDINIFILLDQIIMVSFLLVEETKAENKIVSLHFPPESPQ
jgi:hypothetical protein